MKLSKIVFANLIIKGSITDIPTPEDSSDIRCAEVLDQKQVLSFSGAEEVPFKITYTDDSILELDGGIIRAFDESPNTKENILPTEASDIWESLVFLEAIEVEMDADTQEVSLAMVINLPLVRWMCGVSGHTTDEFTAIFSDQSELILEDGYLSLEKI